MKQFIKKIARKLKKLNKKQRMWVCILAAVLLVGILLLSRFLDGGGIVGDVEWEGETLPPETVETTES